MQATYLTFFNEERPRLNELLSLELLRTYSRERKKRPPSNKRDVTVALVVDMRLATIDLTRDCGVSLNSNSYINTKIDNEVAEFAFELIKTIDALKAELYE